MYSLLWFARRALGVEGDFVVSSAKVAQALRDNGLKRTIHIFGEHGRIDKVAFVHARDPDAIVSVWPFAQKGAVLFLDDSSVASCVPELHLDMLGLPEGRGVAVK